MKILKTTNFNLNSMQKVLKKSTIPVLMLSTLAACTPNYNGNKKDKFEHSNNIELTYGLKKDRNPLETEKITGLRPKEFEVLSKAAGKLINTLYEKEMGKFYFAGTHLREGFVNDYFRIVYENGIDEIELFWDEDRFDIRDYSSKRHHDICLKIEREQNGDFALISRVDSKTEILNFTRDGILKDESYLPGCDKQTEQSQNKKINEVNASNNTNSIYSDIKNIKFFENNNTVAIAKFINALNLSNIEYINDKKDNNIFFMSGKDYSYRLNVKKSENDENTIIGIANKVTNDGKSEIYLVKGEMLSTNKSDKLIISKIRVVQNGLSDSAPVENKPIKETKKYGNNKSVNNHSLEGTVSTPWLRNLFSTNHSKFYNGNISSETVNEIDEMITEVNSDLKTIKIISIDKNTDKVTIQGN